VTHYFASPGVPLGRPLSGPGVCSHCSLSVARLINDWRRVDIARRVSGLCHTLRAVDCRRPTVTFTLSVSSVGVYCLHVAAAAVATVYISMFLALQDAKVTPLPLAGMI